MGAGLLAVKSGFILFIKNYQFPIQINTLEREGTNFSNMSEIPLFYLDPGAKTVLMSYRGIDQFRFLRAACFANIKGSVGLILAKASVIRISVIISIPLDLSSRSFIPLPRFMRPRRAAPLLDPSLVFTPRRFV
jgi:hypothetical protein